LSWLLACFGCSGAIKLTHVIGYAPQGDRVVWPSEKRVLELFDLPSNRAVWHAPLADPASFAAGFVRYSPGGRFFVLWEQSIPDLKADRFSVWDAASGKRISPFYGSDNLPGLPGLEGTLAVSDSGRWVASARKGGHLSIHEAVTQKAVMEEPWRDEISFAPGADILFAKNVAYKYADGVWTKVAELPGAFGHVWAGNRVVFLTDQGVRVWDGATTRLFPYHFDFWHSDKRANGTNGELAASDELFAIYEFGSTVRNGLLEIYDVVTGKQLVSRRGLGSVGQVVFRGRTPIVVVERESYKTFVLELDLATGEIVKETSLGSAASGGLPSSPEVVHFGPELLPQGKYVDLVNASEHRFVRIAGP